jgi:hypothetical protein
MSLVDPNLTKIHINVVREETYFLKPCPFCSSKNLDIKVSPNPSSYHTVNYNVMCLDCGSGATNKSGDIAEIAALWNFVSKRVNGE